MELIERLNGQTEGWGVGPLMAQVAHATAAVRPIARIVAIALCCAVERTRARAQVLHETRDRAETQAYLADLMHMRKVRPRAPLHTQVHSAH